MSNRDCGANSDKQASISDSSLSSELYSSISSTINLFTNSYGIQITDCSTQNPCLQCS